MKEEKEPRRRCEQKLDIHEFSDAKVLFTAQCLLKGEHEGDHHYHIWTVERKTNREGLKNLVTPQE